MAALGLINRYARALLASAVARGHALESLCDHVGVSPQCIHSAELTFGAENYPRLYRHVCRVLDDEFCGMTRHPCQPGTLALMCELVLGSGSLEAALQKAFRFYYVTTEDVRFELLREQEGAVIRLRLDDSLPDRFNFFGEWWLLFWLHFSSWLVGREIPLSRVCFRHRQSGFVEEYSQAFGPHCEFRSRENCLVFDARYLSMPIVKSDADLHAFLSLRKYDLVTFFGATPSLTSRVRTRMRDKFFCMQQFLSMEQLADELHVGSQTLRRRLEEEGTSYRRIKEEIRREAAMIWLRDVEIPIVEVSRMSGFAEANGLSRAVKSWVGLSPTEYRRTILSARRQYVSPQGGML